MWQTNKSLSTRLKKKEVALEANIDFVSTDWLTCILLEL